MKLLHRYIFILLLSFSLSYASLWDSYHLSRAYEYYQHHDYNATRSQLEKIEAPSRESQLLLGDTLYRQGAYKKAIARYESIHSTSITIKQHLYYNIANAYVKLESYNKARDFYAKVLQLGQDEDAIENLRIIALLADKKEGELGIANPKSQNSSSSKSKNKSEKKKSKKKSRDENQPSSGNGGDGEISKEKKREKGKLMSSHKEEKHPLGSKVYELINEGYIYEKQPW